MSAVTVKRVSRERPEFCIACEVNHESPLPTQERLALDLWREEIEHGFGHGAWRRTAAVLCSEHLAELADACRLVARGGE